MVKDIIRYDGKEYQLSTINTNGCLETMVFPIENGVVSGKEVYCFRTTDGAESASKHLDIYQRPFKYLSESAISEYLKSKEEPTQPQYRPCFECLNRYGRQYTEECDSFCEYAMALSKLKPYGGIDVVLTTLHNGTLTIIDSILEEIQDQIDSIRSNVPYSHDDEVKVDKLIDLYHDIQNIANDKNLVKVDDHRLPKKVVKNTIYGSYRCPKCDKVLHITDHYCNQCGQKLDWRME